MQSLIKKKYLIILLSAVLLYACNRKSVPLELVPGIKISLPETSKITVENPKESTKTWQVSFDDDHLKIFDFRIILNDTFTREADREFFRKNIDSFLKPFNYTNIDSSYSFRGNILQCDLGFDFIQGDEDIRLFTRFLLSQDHFIAFCFQTPFPIDRYSISLKDKIFKSIETR